MKWTVFFNIATKSARHPHAWMITVVEMKKSKLTSFIYIYAYFKFHYRALLCTCIFSFELSQTITKINRLKRCHETMANLEKHN